MRKKNNAILYSLVFLLFAGSVGYLCFNGFAENSVYFLTVSEAKAMEPATLKQARLFGLVSNAKGKDGSLAFNLTDKDSRAQTIPVVYQGVAPDSFKEGAEVIVEGSMKEDGNFLANLLMTKCPSKYKKENRNI